MLWGWIGQPLTGEELTGVTAVRDGLEADLGEALAEHLSPAELHALRRRCDDLSETGVFPGPAGDMPAVPWPVF